MGAILRAVTPISTLRSAALLLPLFIVAAGSGERTAAQQPARSAQDQGQSEIHVLPVQGNVYMLVGPVGNTTVQVEPPTRPPRIPGVYQGSYGVVVVDTQLVASAEALRAAIRRISQGPIRFIINTHIHPESIGGNEVVARREGRGGDPTLIVSHENVLLKLAEEGRVPQGGLPTDSYLDVKEIWLNGEAIQVFHQPNAHTDGDSIVYFRRSDVISAGDIFQTRSYPVIDAAHGGSIQGIIEGLNRILDLAIPENSGEGGTRIVPGQGRLSDESDVVEYRNMVVIIRDRIQDMVKKGMTLEQVKAARPTLDYDFRYGANRSWTGDMFVEAVYTELKKVAAPAGPARRTSTR
jgi:glyoxylase-like metal-dependent hydrolase (beta-lactamase superfamily II)